MIVGAASVGEGHQEREEADDAAQHMPVADAAMPDPAASAAPGAFRPRLPGPAATATLGAAVIEAMTAAAAKVIAASATDSTRASAMRLDQRCGSCAHEPGDARSAAASREFFSTSSSWLLTVVGTMAALAMAYPFCSTRMANARGNSSRLSRLPIIRTAITTRTALMAMTMARRPPLARSSAGPIRGLTNANGAMVRPR